MTFTRYAIYYTPPAASKWGRLGTSWLGWDLETRTEPQPPQHAALTGLDIPALTGTPRKYGLHATLKPPMRLAEGITVSALDQACAALATRQPPVILTGLELARLGRFLALRTTGDEARLKALSAACVRDLDAFRAPATDAELAQRRQANLNNEQETNLTTWGYPHVMEAFKFHITLTSKLPKPALPAVEVALDAALGPLLPAPFEIRDIALVGEATDGRFHLIQRYPLTG